MMGISPDVFVFIYSIINVDRSLIGLPLNPPGAHFFNFFFWRQQACTAYRSVGAYQAVQFNFQCQV